jgi:Ca-activated chloride channel family protein
MKAFLLALLASAFLAALPGAKTSGGTADDYVHGGAAKYIQGRLQEAGVEVEEGLRHYPNDARLKALSDQLKKMKDQQKKDQGGQDSQGGDQNQDKKDQKDSADQGKDGKQEGKKDDQKDKGKEKEKDKQEGQDKDKGQGDQEQAKPEEGKEGDSTGQAAAPAKPGQMSKEEAERLLNSYQDDEKREQKNLQKRYKKPVEVEEDW